MVMMVWPHQTPAFTVTCLTDRPVPRSCHLQCRVRAFYAILSHYFHSQGLTEIQGHVYRPGDQDSSPLLLNLGQESREGVPEI